MESANVAKLRHQVDSSMFHIFLAHLADSDNQKKAIDKDDYYWAVEYAREPPQYGSSRK